MIKKYHMCASIMKSEYFVIGYTHLNYVLFPTICGVFTICTNHLHKYFRKLVLLLKMTHISETANNMHCKQALYTCTIKLITHYSIAHIIKGPNIIRSLIIKGSSALTFVQLTKPGATTKIYCILYVRTGDIYGHI